MLTDPQIAQLVEEIFHVFKQVESVIPGLAGSKLNANASDWLPLQKGQKITMRDYILLSYAKDLYDQDLNLNQDLLLTCALSFDIVSSARHFDVDHFVRHEAAEINCFYGQEPRRNLLFRQQFPTHTCDCSNAVVRSYGDNVTAGNRRGVCENESKSASTKAERG